MTDILHQNTNRALVSMSVPISIGMLSTFLFQVVDTYFVGQLGPAALAALSFSSTVYFLVVGAFMGLAAGISIIVGNAIGAGDQRKVQSTFLVGILLGIGTTTAMTWLIISHVEALFLGLGAAPDIIPLITDYMKTLLAGMVLLTFGLIAGAALRATGIVVLPEAIMGAAGVLNLILDYGLIFGHWGLPNLGIRGAALATVLSWVFVAIGMTIILFQKGFIAANGLLKGLRWSLVKEISTLAMPTIVTQIIGPLTLLYLTYLLAQQSQLAVAAFGVASRIETLLMIGILGVSTAITPFIAQNIGARQSLRVDQAIAFGGRASTYLGILVILILYLFIRPIAGLFTDSEEVIRYTTSYFYWVSLSYTAYGLYLITTSIYNGLKLPINSMKITLIKTTLFTVPCTLIGSFWGVPGIFLGLMTSNFLAGAFAARQMRQTFLQMNSELAKINIWKAYAADLRSLGRRLKGR